MIKLGKLKGARHILNQKLEKKRDKNSEFKPTTSQRMLSLINILIEQGEKGNFTDIDKHLIWDKYAIGKNEWLFSEDPAILEEIKNLKKEDRILDNEFVSLKTNYRSMEDKNKNGLGMRNGFPEPLRIKCFQCKENIVEVKYVVPNKSYSRKNNWEYWTNPQAKDPDYWKDKEARKKDKQICNTCLRKLYYNKEVYWETIKDLKTRGKLKTYIFNGTISA